MLKEALYREYPFLALIPSIIKARRVTVNYFELKPYDFLWETAANNEEWYIVAANDRASGDGAPRSLKQGDTVVVPVPAWEGDCLGDCVMDAIQRPLGVVRYLVCVESYTTPSIVVNIYETKDMTGIINDAIDSEVQELRLKREATIDWTSPTCAAKPEVCDD